MAVIRLVIRMLYIPVYLLAWGLYICSKVLLGISYFGILDPLKGKNVFMGVAQDLRFIK